MKAAAIIAAAGIGKRMGGRCPKQYLELCGRPIICHTLDRFRAANCINEVIVVVEPGRDEFFRKEILEKFNYPKHWKVTGGGGLRQESVGNGLKLVSPDTEVVIVHDGVRPFITPKQIEHAAEVAFKDGACIVAAKIKDTIKRVAPDGFILETVDRESLWGAKTPQAFLYPLIKEAFHLATRDGFIGTDEASLVERMGAKITVLEGDECNIKITTPADMLFAEAILKEWK